MTDVQMKSIESNIDGINMFEGHKKGLHKSKVSVQVIVDKETKEKCAGLIKQYVKDKFGNVDCYPHGPSWYSKDTPYSFTVTFTRKWKYKNDFVSPQGLFGILTASHGDLVKCLTRIIEQAKRDHADQERAKLLIREVNHVASQFQESCIKKGKEAIGYEEKLAALYAELEQAAKDALRKEIEEEDWTYSSGTPIPALVRTMVLERADTRLSGELKVRRAPFFFFDDNKELNEHSDEDLQACVERIRTESPDYKFQDGDDVDENGNLIDDDD